ncbi:porin family protein [Pontibacter virosus]|uniref:Outer membrane protein with beta-barrel domain n=1 Tax=Pontibacter virosus TaxID=1765052 RepID=A0A2U1AS21_9BACT|nr:porin family protein [Pontibacter virosus]PVY39226.1 outer membrane protein with beta-barrel domain [Pontibacter virosus]
MKKIILLMGLLFVISFRADAQYYRYGVKAGGGFSKAVGSDAPSDQINHLAGIHGAFVFAYEFASRLSVQPELHFSRKGFTYDNYTLDRTDGTALTGDLRLDYIELPLMIKLQKAALFVEAGPYMGYLLNVGNEVNIVSTDPTPDPPIVIGREDFSRDNFNSFDAGYAVGGGLMLESGFFLNVRHTGSLRPFPKQDLSQRNLVWQLSIGYMLPARRPGNW